MSTKKGTVIQAKALDSFEYDGKTYYPYGIVIKYNDKDSDVGIYYSKTKKQDYFVVGREAEYTIDINEKEQKKSKIKPVIKKETQTKDDNFKMTADEYVNRQIANTPSYTASYVSNMLQGRDIKDIKENFAAIADIVYEWQISKLKK